ncbi:MAG: bifunctional diaminohydroxyphosphoribosylaminopyrimidine deaminase/5-amino-6-(5-phosphoribosylamino)uracil reductase RibD [Actinobacteria bacterium]|nr:bifunctional diaminohydroxyphosphoribosylaminopyrimidine deaminase/5-amino-6-(5-phosphoribosylamino)uracil reductase RibD [Actinomycetota bacterium]
MTDDERYMALAIDLARRPPFTSPNPRVGAVLVRGDEVVGEGWHAGIGSLHAEAAALTGVDAPGATMYVTLEPCAHQGRTPPCTEALIASGVARVVAAVEDPDVRVRGRGFKALRDAGIEVTVGTLAGEAADVNAQFIHHRLTQRPFVTLKLALSVDGRLGAEDGTSRWITGEEARRRVHARRLEADAVLIGSGTAITDDPSLVVAGVPAVRNPLRVVVDSTGSLSPGARLFDGSAALLVATTDRSSHEVQTAWKEAGAEVLLLSGTDDGVDLDELLDLLGARDVVEVYCEGGATLATSLLRRGLVQRLEIYHAPILLGGGGPALGDLGVGTMTDAVRWKVHRASRIGEDVLTVYEPAEA